MSSIVIAFPASRNKLSSQIREFLITHGFSDVIQVPNGSEALQEMNKRNNGIVITCTQLPDMYYRELMDYLPPYFSLLLLDSANNISNLREPDIIAHSLPIKLRDFFSTVRMMDDAAEQSYQQARNRQKKKGRSPEEQQDIDKAKAILMERNHMSEEEAHRYLQKTSMDTGRSMVESAQMILLFAQQ